MESSSGVEGARPPAPNEGTVSVLAQVLAVGVLIALGYLFKSIVLNWVVGPLFVLFVLVVIPRAFGRSRSG